MKLQRLSRRRLRLAQKRLADEKFEKIQLAVQQAKELERRKNYYTLPTITFMAGAFCSGLIFWSFL